MSELKPPRMPAEWGTVSDVICLEHVQPEAVEFLWEPYIPKRKVTIVQGDPGQGKTTLLLHLAALLSQGKPLPYDDTVRPPMNILYQTAEDGLADTIKPRLMGSNADCSRILVIDETDKPLSITDERLERVIRENHIGLAILDPIQAYLGDATMNCANEVRPKMARLLGIAERNDCSVVLIGHLNKSKAGGKAAYRGLGSIDFLAAARSVLLVGQDPKQKDIRAVLHLKSSLSLPGKTIAFTLGEAHKFRWVGEYPITAEELLQPANAAENKLNRAQELLISMLREGPCLQKEVLTKALSIGISERTLNEAKKVSGVRSQKQGAKWYWTLSENEEQEMLI